LPFDDPGGHHRRMSDSTGAEVAEAPTPWPAIAGIIATVSVFAIAQGLTYPLLSSILERLGQSPSMIGLSAAMTPLGIISSASLIPILSRRFGAGRTALSSAAIAALLLALIGWTRDPAAWFPLRFLLGAVINPLYVLSEVWMVTLAPPSRRGRLLGFYAMVISGGFAVGPLCLAFVGAEGSAPFLIGIGAFIVCGACLAAVLPRLPRLDLHRDAASIRDFVPLAQVLLLSVVVAAAFEQMMLALMPVYGPAHGMDETRIAALLTVFIAGNVALQVPLGLAAERWSARKILILCAVLSGAGSLLLIPLVDTFALWPLAFVIGAVSFGLYSVALVELGERFSGAMLVAGNSAFAMMYGIGGLTGPPGAGAVMDAIGPNGLPVSLGVMSLALAAFAILRRR
jgi:MFS family permease